MLTIATVLNARKTPGMLSWGRPLGLLVLLLSLHASAADKAPETMNLSMNTALLERNISTCPDSVKKEKQKNIDELKVQPVNRVTVWLTGEFMTKYVEFSNGPTCSIGLLDNAVLLLEAYLEQVDQPIDVKRELAEAKLMRAAFRAPEERGGSYREADTLIRTYLQEEPINPNEEIATPHYFAAHAYLEAAKITQDDAKIDLLDKAIAIGNQGRAANVSRKMKEQLSEPIGVALGEKAKYYKDKDERKFGDAIQASLVYFKEGFESGDNLAAYNIAVSYTILRDADNAKRWFQIIEERKLVDQQICRDGLLRDPDLNWLRDTQMDWMVAYFRKNCLPFVRVQ